MKIILAGKMFPHVFSQLRSIKLYSLPTSEVLDFFQDGKIAQNLLLLSKKMR